MQAAGSVSAYFAGLVHPPARRVPLQQLLQQDFIASKLIFIAFALAGTPIFIALRGAPSPGEAGIFTLVLLQLLPVMLVTRRGWLVLAQELAVVGLLGVGALAALLPAAHPLAAAAWFAAAAVEALLGCAGVTGCLLAALGVASAAAATCLALAPAVMPPQAALIAAAAALPALAAAWRGRRARRELAFAAAEAQRRNDILAGLADVVAIDADAAGRVGQVSANSSILFGISSEELHGRGLLERILVADRPAFLKLASDAAHGREAGRAMVRLRCPSPLAAPADGAAPRHAAIEVRAIPDGDGVALLLRDVDASRTADAAVAAAGSETTVARPPGDPHPVEVPELRASLNAVIGFAEILASQTLRPAGAEKQREYARIILASGRHLLAVVDAMPGAAKAQPAAPAPDRATAAVASLPPSRGFARSQMPADPALLPIFGGDPVAGIVPIDERRPTRDIRMKRSA